MLYREIMAVCSEIHTKHINTLCGQNVELLNVKLAVHIVRLIPSVCTPQSDVLQAKAALQKIARRNWQSCWRDIYEYMPVPAIAWQPRRYADGALTYLSIALQPIPVNDTRLTAQTSVLKTVQAPVTNTHYPITSTCLDFPYLHRFLLHLALTLCHVGKFRCTLSYQQSVSSSPQWARDILTEPPRLHVLT